MANLATFYRTRYGSIVMRKSAPDELGYMTVLRLSDSAVRDWNIADMHPLDADEAASVEAAYARAWQALS